LASPQSHNAYQKEKGTFLCLPYAFAVISNQGVCVCVCKYGGLGGLVGLGGLGGFGRLKVGGGDGGDCICYSQQQHCTLTLTLLHFTRSKATSPRAKVALSLSHLGQPSLSHLPVYLCVCVCL